MDSHSSHHHEYQRVFAEHKALKILLARIDRVLSEQDCTIEEASNLLAQLGDRLVRHFSMEEHSGYFADALTHAPGLISRANELMAQHPKMCVQARGLVDIGETDPGQDWWQETMKRFDAFRRELLEHEQREDRLLQEAYNRDLGAND